MKTHARVVIVGGGVAGASCVYHLTKMGCSDVVLVEKNELTSGSTWLAAGNIPTYAMNRGLMRAGNYAWHLYGDLADAVGCPIDYHLTGAFWPAHVPERMELFEHIVGISKGLGLGMRTLTPAEMEAMHPFYSAADTLGGIHDPYEGNIDPAQVTQAMVAGARQGGAKIVRFNPVSSITRTAGNEWCVHTEQGDIICEIVVNAAGYYGKRVAEMLGQSLPMVTLEHQYLVTSEVPELVGREDRLVLVRDPDMCFYVRQEGMGLLLGSYGHKGHPAWPDEIPDEFNMQVFPDRVDDMEWILEKAIQEIPLLEQVGIQRFVNGPIPYSPDGQPLVGPSFGLENVYLCCCFPVGITHAPAAGKAIAEWVVEGETEWDMWGWDPRRFGEWATTDYTVGRACELYENQYAIPYPHRQWKTGRPVYSTPLYKHLADKGAVFGQIGGWERALWFQRDGVEDDGHLSYHREVWHDVVRGECRAVRDAVGIMDHGGFTRYEVSGPGAAVFVDHMICGDLPKPGRIKLAYMLTAKGMVFSEVTVTRLAEDRFLLCGPTLADLRDFDWLRCHLPEDGSVNLRHGSDFDGALMLMGPKSRELLSRVSDVYLSTEAAPWMSVREIVVAGIPVRALRVSFVGELGWELHVPMEQETALYNSLWGAGSDLGLRDFGSYALNAMRLEKGYHGWQADLGPEYTPFDAGLDRFVKPEKPGFVGRDAVLRHREAGRSCAFAAFLVDAGETDPLPGDPICQKGEIVGYVTSGGYGYRIDKSIALGYVRSGLETPGGNFEIVVLGIRKPARLVSTPIYDPANQRVNS